MPSKISWHCWMLGYGLTESKRTGFQSPEAKTRVWCIFLPHLNYNFKHHEFYFQYQQCLVRGDIRPRNPSGVVSALRLIVPFARVWLRLMGISPSHPHQLPLDLLYYFGQDLHRPIRLEMHSSGLPYRVLLGFRNVLARFI